MRPPSRTMPASPRPTLAVGRPLTILFLAMLGAGFAWMLYAKPAQTLTLVGVLVAIGFLAALATNPREVELARRAAERGGESICTFARAFDYRNVDTWILRAVFEELQPWAEFGDRAMPIRPGDDLEVDLWVDSDDLDSLIEDIAFRSRRSIADCSRNPLLGRIRTVADLVAFLMHQPSTRPASA